MSGLEFKLHPLVIVNVSDHYTRCSLNVKEGGRVVGCLLGEQKGRVIHIVNSFEVNLTSGADSNEQSIDVEHLKVKKEQYKTVFPALEVVGWYSTGNKIQENDMQIHRVVSELNESPVFLLLDPAIVPGSSGNRDLPIVLHETELHVIDGVPSQIFVQARYTVDSLEAERIAVDQVARALPSGSATCSEQLASHMMGTYNAIKMLRDRIAAMHGALTRMRAGETPCDHALLREVSSLVRRLPLGNSSAIQGNLLLEHNDSLLVTYLALMTKGSAAMHDVVNKINVTYERSGTSHRRSMF